MAKASPSPTKSRWRRAGWIALGLAASLAIVAAWLYYEATSVPEFYAKALVRPPSAPPAKVAADRVERDVLSVQNELERARPWRLVLKDEDINDWLATELAKKAPKALPKEIEDPRIAIHDGAIYVACKYPKIGGVLSLALVPAMTDKPNELAVRVQSFSVGRLPLPQKQYLEEVSKAAAKANLPLRWEEREGTAVAMVAVPERFENLKDRTVKLESIQVGEGEIVIQGTAERTK